MDIESEKMPSSSLSCSWFDNDQLATSPILADMRVCSWSDDGKL